MPAPKGNEFYKLVLKKTGSPKKFKSPDELMEKACEYFQWCEDNPLEKTLTFQGEVTGVDKLQRPFTIDGLCLYIGLDATVFNTYEKADTHKEFHSVVKQIKTVIRTQKFEGASVGLFNPNIIARDLGLADKQNVESKNVNVNATIPDSASPKDAAQAYMDAIKGE